VNSEYLQVAGELLLQITGCGGSLYENRFTLARMGEMGIRFFSD
jgi:hypothetical protein